MKNNIQTFDFTPGLSIRAIVKDGQPWFIAKEVCTALDHKNVSEAVADHVDPEDKSSVSLGLPGKAPLVVNESGLYALIMRSKKPEARAFQRWVTSTVLPALRQGGVYFKGQEKVDLASMSYAQALDHINELKAKVAEAEAIRWAKSREERNSYRDAMKFLSRRSSKTPTIPHHSHR